MMIEISLTCIEGESRLWVASFPSRCVTVYTEVPMRISLRILCSVVALAVALCTLTLLGRVNATKQNADKLINKRREAPNQPVEILEM
jgi:hypothetical protein